MTNPNTTYSCKTCDTPGELQGSYVRQQISQGNSFVWTDCTLLSKFQRCLDFYKVPYGGASNCYRYLNQTTLKGATDDTNVGSLLCQEYVKGDDYLGW
jgi:hypothetical protein